MIAEKVELFTEGCLGTCWYGKYHYLEPWAGCGHNCPYCYGRFRSPVKHALADLGTTFSSPRPLLPRKELLAEIEAVANQGHIHAVKLCRYTDIFTPTFVENGLAEEILAVLAESRVQRIIITTKGLPSEAIIRLMACRPEKFSYNAAARPETGWRIEPSLKELGIRLAVAARIQESGVLTTLHMDPFIPTIDDEPEALGAFLTTLKHHGLQRVMFSYLLLTDDMAASMEQELGSAFMEKLRGIYDDGSRRQYLPSQEETVYWGLRNEVKRASVMTTAHMLEAMGFDYVLCSLKNVPGLDLGGLDRRRICDGAFYA